MIVDPWGRIVAEKNDDEPGVIVADIDLADVAAGARQNPEFAQYTPL
jgi:predicted amidohydrolase